MSAELGIPIARLRAELAAHAPQLGRLEAVRKYPTGQSNPTFELATDRGLFVLRAKPPGKLLKSAHMVEREFRVMGALAGTEVPVPRVHCLVDGAETALGRAWFVMDHVAGRIFWDPALPDCSRSERGAIYDAMNETLAALHAVDPSAVGLGDFGRPGDYFARQVSRWSAQYRATASPPDPRLERAMEWLEANLPADDGRVALVHGDFRLDNMIFHPTEPRVVALLDWELSTLGHPLADLAYQCAQWRLPNGGGLRGLGHLDRAGLGVPDEAEYVARYLSRTGGGAIAHWPFYVVFSLFRIAAILQGVVRRAEDGNASNPEGARRYRPLIPVLAEMAAAAMDEAEP